MTFEEAVNATAALAGRYRRGLQGIKNVDRNRIRTSRPRRLKGSVDLDKALRPQRPNAPIWDYCIGLRNDRNNDRVVWLEVHPASSPHAVHEVLRKLGWLRDWLPAEAPALRQIEACFVWLATASVAFTANSPQRRRIAQSGILFRSRVLDLDGVY